jgi:hypothetical protein
LPTFQYDPLTFNFGWDLIIHDRDYVGAILNLDNITESGVVIKNEGGRGDMNKAIVPTVAEFTLLIDDQDTQDFIDDISLADEERFYIEVRQKETVRFIGYILLDQVVEDITEGPRLLTIKAVDGLSRMKEIKYPVEDWELTYPLLSNFGEFSYPTFTEIIVRCFEECNITPLYAADFPLFNIYINWKEAEMAVADPTRPSTFDQVRCQNKLFYNLNDDQSDYYDTPEAWSTNYKTRSKAMSCYKVLEVILTVFHAKIFYDEGRYYIRHAWGSESSDRVMTWHHYTKNGTPIDSSTMDRSQDLGYLFADDLRMIKPSSIEYVAPHKYVELNFQGLSETPINGYVWKGADASWQGVNYFIEGESVSLPMEFTHVPYLNGNITQHLNDTWTFRFQVRIGTYYLQRYYNGDTSVWWKGEWVEDDTLYIEHIPSQGTFDGGQFYSNIEYAVDEAPIDGPMEIRLIFAEYKLSTTAKYSEILNISDTMDSYVDAAYVGTNYSMTAGLITQNLNPEEDETTIYRSGDISGNSRSKSITTLLGNNQDVSYSLAQLFSYQGTSGLWKPRNTDQPDPNWGSGNIIQTKLVESYAKTHTEPRKILNMVLDDVKNRVTFNTVLVYEGFDYMPISMEYVTSLDRYKGQWVQIGKTDNTVTVDIFFQPTKGGLDTIGFSNPTDEQLASVVEDSGGVADGVLIKSRSYTISNSSTAQILTHTIPVDITSKYTRPSIDDSYIMFVNGVRWRFVPTLGEVDKAGVFTLEPSTLNWVIWRGIDAEIRLEVWDRLIIELNPIS